MSNFALAQNYGRQQTVEEELSRELWDHTQLVAKGIVNNHTNKNPNDDEDAGLWHIPVGERDGKEDGKRAVENMLFTWPGLLNGERRA